MRYLLFILLFFIPQIVLAEKLPLNLLKLPLGFTINIFAYPVPNAREMVFGSKNILFVGSRDEGKVYAIIPDKNTAYKTKVLIIASGLKMPNGVAFYQNDLYVADINKILRFKDIEKHLDHPLPPVVVTESLPDKTHHGWRYIRLGPDQKLYIGIGAPCNNCLSTDERFATIIRMDLKNHKQEIFARGVRNTVGFDWHPETHELWFTDNGRDWMGDDIPPDELNLANKIDMNFGYPYCHGKNISDPEYGKQFPCSAFVPPILELKPHAAALGMTFYTGTQFPAEYRNQLFIAEHGSWNRSTKIGYDIELVRLSKNRIISTQPFITGWVQHAKAWGRPVDVINAPDGSLLISDDYAGVIYRVSYIKKD